MDGATCLKNITSCLLSFGLRLCDAEKDICSQHGYCITSIFNQSISTCVCYPCYTGKYCEEDSVSKNAWSWGLGNRQSVSTLMAMQNVSFVISIISMLNGMLCLQTCLASYMIRVSNIGIYLISATFSLLLFSVINIITTILILSENSGLLAHVNIVCIIISKYVVPSLMYIRGWLIALVSFERMLCVCFSYSVFDSRKRSIIVSTFVVVICILTTLPGTFMVKESPSDKLQADAMEVVACVNYTPMGYIFNKAFTSIHIYAPLLFDIALLLTVFGRLLQHRRRLLDSCKTAESIRTIFSKHRYLFIPLILEITCSIPQIIFLEMMTCERAATASAFLYIYFAIVIIGTVPDTFSFIIYIYICNVYMTEFWRASIVGRLLVKLNKKIPFKRMFTYVISIFTTSPTRRLTTLRWEQR